MIEKEARAIIEEFISGRTPTFDQMNANSAKNLQLHAQFKGLMENLVCAKIRERFSSGAVDQFFVSFSKKAKEFEQIDAATTQSVLELVEIRAFNVAMKIRKEIYIKDRIDRDENEHFEIRPMEGEDLFWQFYGQPDETWTKHTDFTNESVGLSGVLFKKQVDGYLTSVFRGKVVYKN